MRIISGKKANHDKGRVKQRGIACGEKYENLKWNVRGCVEIREGSTTIIDDQYENRTNVKGYLTGQMLKNGTGSLKTIQQKNSEAVQ